MDASESIDASTLRQRIAILESELQRAQLAKTEAEAHLESEHHALEVQTAHKKAAHKHHAAANLASYGHSDDIIFVEPEERRGIICEISEGSGFGAFICRIMIRYNIDQFLQRPVLHQWLQNGKIYREASERQSSRFELFFDLLFIGLVHQIAEAAAEQPTGIGFARYVLTFAPAFSIWGDVRDTANQFANDDSTQRAYILWIMILLVGYSNNASAIEWGEGEQSDTGSVSESSTAAIRWSLGFFVVAKLSKVILNQIYGIFLPLSRKPLLIASFNSAMTAVLFFVAIFTPFHGTITLVAVGIVLDYVLRILGVMVFKTIEILGRKRDRIRRKSITEGASQSPDTDSPREDKEGSPYDGRRNIRVYERSRTLDSSITAINEEAPLGTNRQCNEAVTKQFRIPAVNIEHHVERLGAFVTIVLGEMVVNIFFTSTSAIGLNPQSGRAFLGLMIAFNLNWMYFDSQACKTFVHALRRHWLTSFLFTMLHLPLCMSLLLASSAMHRLVVSPTPESESGGGLKWFFGTGLGVSVCTMATIGVLHKNMDDEIPDPRANAPAASITKTRTFSRRVVLGTRYAAGIAMALVPLAKNLSSIKYLGIYVGITAFLIIEETIARIERREWELDEMAEREGVV